MAYKLQTEIGQAIYRLQVYRGTGHHWHRQRSLGLPPILVAGLVAAAGEWCLVCLAFNVKRLHVLLASS